MINVIILNHFTGYPALENKISNKIRYSNLLKLIDMIDGKNTIFLDNSSKNKDKKLESIKRISMGYQHKWLDFKDNQDVENIIRTINENYSITLSPKTANIVLIGTNTAGCLLRTSLLSAKQWASRKFNVHFCLSMCTDYELDGINTIEKNQMATAIMYSFIKDNNFIDYINVCYDPRELKIER